ncbi:MAG: cytochrome b5-like heme/steroid binding domain-containing protein [Patescibacteria group bacterium]
MKKENFIGLLLLAAAVILTVVYFVDYQRMISQQGGFDSSVNLPSNSSPIAPGGNIKNTLNLTAEEVAKHSSAGDCWMIISGKVYAVTDYAALHPGGAKRILDFCGRDATQAFLTKGGQGTHSSAATAQHATLLLGQIGSAISPEAAKAVEQNTQKIKPPQGREEEDEGEDD